ncbi:uncharacterized protein LOC127259027 [Andrographis paniculata]|uniref:uncharacterized protein LOC127259027 n=1 Tax=Andrographis paniculata TaxID=175694 RepID=UPI0021E7D045|nr:uncharacterized protein LOC127259027 [Andrographis paniculata]
MMLRSSSTPILGSLLASFSDSPSSNSHQHLSELHGCTHRHTSGSKISCLNNNNNGGSHGKPLFQYSPSVGEAKGVDGGRFRRAQSEGNLGDLVAGAGADEFSLSKKPARKTNFRSLEAIPSFSTHLGTNSDSDDEPEEEQEHQEFELEGFLAKSSNIVMEEGRMYLATGLGVSGLSLTADIGGNSGGGGSYRPPVVAEGGGGGNGGRPTMEEHYKKMLEGDPGNPMVLRNYAQFLHQEKGDLQTAEEYYSRAILADPKDGEILSKYAKLIWELHHDNKRAADYFERAIQASSDDSHVHAAYASFLWDAEEDEEEEDDGITRDLQPVLHQGFVASASA